MGVTRVAVALLGGTIFAVSTAFIACGGDDSSPNNPGNDAGPGTDSTTNNPDTGGGGPKDSSAPRDARAPDPGQVLCGTQSCNTDNQVCCRRGGTNDSCVGDTGPVCDGIEVACDEKADCTDPANPVCCGSVSSTGDFGVECAPSCAPASGRQICKTDAECGDAGACITQTCRGIRLSTCGGIPQDLCTEDTDD